MSKILRYGIPALILAGAVGAYSLLHRESENHDVNPPINLPYVSENFDSDVANPRRYALRPLRATPYSENSISLETRANEDPAVKVVVGDLENFFKNYGGANFTSTNYQQLDSLLKLIPEVRKHGLVSLLEKSGDHRLARYSCGDFEIEEEENRFNFSEKVRENPDYTIVFSKGSEANAPSFVYTFIASGKFEDSFHEFNGEHNVVPGKENSYFRTVGRRNASSNIDLSSQAFLVVGENENSLDWPNLAGMMDVRFMPEFRTLCNGFMSLVDSRYK